MHLDDLPVLPTTPGVYIFRGKGTPIYIGKANNLRGRVGQHFKAGGKIGAGLPVRRRNWSSFRPGIEVEALVLEANLIKQHRPHYNVLLERRQALPVFETHLRTVSDADCDPAGHQGRGQYYGPYPDASAVRRVKHLIDTMFPLRKNSGLPMQKKPRPCLNYHMGRCLGPCVDRADLPSMRRVVDDVKSLLEGRAAGVVAQLKDEMKDAAQGQDFEQAGRLRDRLQAVEKLFGTEQAAMQTGGEDLDFLGYAQAGEFAMVQLFRMRGGRVVGRDKRFLTGAAEAGGEIMGAFVQDYYAQATHMPPLICFPPSTPTRRCGPRC